MVFGSVDLQGLRARLAGDGLVPIATGENRGLACLWFSDFFDSTVGAYRELTVNFFVSTEERRLAWRSYMTPVVAQFEPGILICEYTLLLDNPAAIDYGRQLHGFDKHPGSLSFDAAIEAGSPVVRISVSEGRARVVDAVFRDQWNLRSTLGAFLALRRACGMLHSVRLLSKKLHRVCVVTPSTVRSLRTDIYFSGRALVRPFGTGDKLDPMPGHWVGELLIDLGFAPEVVQKIPRARGVMPLPLGPP